MNRSILYAPWRSDYSSKIDEEKGDAVSLEECIFCQQFSQSDDERFFILRRFNYCAVMLNLYPYNAGHLLVLPFSHCPFPADIALAAQIEFTQLMSHSVSILQNVLHAQGVNVGINVGKAAGAGIPSHLHMHVLPRWQGDTNFMPTLAQTKQISFDLRQVYEKLKPAFDELSV